jgi:hypothetical protein
MAYAGVSISWVRGHRRSREIAEVVGVQPHFVRSASRALPLRYLDQFRSTRAILSRDRPDVVVVMQPPPFALASVTAYARRHGTVVIGDLHSGVFLNPKWSWASKWVLKQLKRHGGAVVPNADLAALCRVAGVPVFVSHGWITPLEDKDQSLPAGLAADSIFVLVPFTYSRDEPVVAVLAAASQTPSVVWVLTGRPPEEVRRRAPANVLFTGYVEDDQFQALQLHARAILALTTRPSTMQSAGYEAVASATPLITVKEPVLVDYFGEHAMYSGLESRELAQAVSTVVADNDHWRAQMTALRQQVRDSQGLVVEQIRHWAQESVTKRARKDA